MAKGGEGGISGEWDGVDDEPVDPTAPVMGGAVVGALGSASRGKRRHGMATREELLSEVGELAAHNEATYLG